MSDEREKWLAGMRQLVENAKVPASSPLRRLLAELDAAEARERETAGVLADLLQERGVDVLIDAAYRRGVRDGAEARLGLLRANGRWEAVVTPPGGARKETEGPDEPPDWSQASLGGW
jgi:hypothetical protein